MKKVKNRGAFVLLIALFCVLGLSLYCARYVMHGREWASFAGGGTTMGLLYDRNEVLLADAGAGTYSEDYTTRVANFHVTGDYIGNVGTGALTRLTDQ